MMLNIFAAGLVFLFLLSLHYLWEQTKEDIQNSIDRDISRDFYRSAEAMKFCSWRDADGVIDDFEARWKPYVSKSKLDTYIGKLIEAQLQKELQ